MSELTPRTIISKVPGRARGQRGVSAVTIAVMLAAMAVVTLTIVQAATTGDASTVQSGIPGLIG
ncbi:MAG: hypothetical protein QF357_01585 [Dehalococcoidia bacterium]|jgi:hypothetical protein|nr:hypothetical protein [Dehalococcoidia bacterium]